jgi:hypothetical protein
MWKKGTIETHLNLAGKKEAVWAKFLDDLDNSDLPTLLPDDYLEIQKCMNWLLS